MQIWVLLILDVSTKSPSLPLYNRIIVAFFIDPNVESLLALTLIIFFRQSLMDSMAAQKDADFCVKEEPRMAVEDLVQLFIDRDTLAK